MKELILIRHAKSDWGNEGVKDIDRHLNDRGYNDAYLLSKWYAKHQAIPEKVLSSSATRALSTALIFARSMNLDLSHFVIDERIYESSLQGLLTVIKEQDDSLSSVMLFGHNPSISDLSNYLAGDLHFDNVPTCGIVSFKVDADSWRELKPGKTKVNYDHYPKNLKNQN